jgi:hypothetical protein
VDVGARVNTGTRTGTDGPLTFWGGLPALLEGEVDGSDDERAGGGHSGEGCAEVGGCDDEDAADGWGEGLLFSAVDEVAEADGAPDEGGEERAGVQEVHGGWRG